MRLFIFLFFIFISFNSFSAAPLDYFSLSGFPAFTDVSKACSAAVGSRYNSQGFLIDSYKSYDSSLCYYQVSLSGTNSQGGSKTYYKSTLCPDKSTPNFSKPLDQQCPEPDPCQKLSGKSIDGGELQIAVSSSKSPFPESFCHNGCNASGPANSYADFYSSLNGKWTATIFGDRVGKRHYSGTSCDATTKDVVAGASKCPKNQCPGQVNGVDVCVQCDSFSAGTGNDAGSTTQKADGSTLTTKSTSTTTCQGDSCTTSTTTTNSTKNSDGSDGGTETKTEDKTESKETFCKQNPTFAACIPSGFSSSSCGVVPACTGDAIQCAIAQQQHKSYCDLMVTSTPVAELGLNSANGQLTPEGHPLNSAEQSPFNFASAFNASGGGGCPADVEVMGVTVPLSNTCDGLNALGVAALGISLIWAARIVFAG